MHPTLSALGIGALLVIAGAARAEDPACWVYFGSSTTDSNRGIYLSKLDQETGSISPARRVANRPDSEFFAFSPDKKHLYSVANASRSGFESVEAIESYAVDAATGTLTHLAERVVGGPVSCHISVDPSGRCVLTANYDGAYVEAFPIAADATVGERTSLVRHSGFGPNRTRQASAHPHSVNVDPTGRFAVVADLGTDKLYVYRLDAARGMLSPGDPQIAGVTPGSGPRHFAFHPGGKHAFVICELSSSITAFNWDAEAGTLTPYQTIPILRNDYSGQNTAAEVVVGKDGRFLYGSNRGDDSIAVLAVDSATGRMTFVQRMADGVKTPRNFAIDPSGRWLVCGNLGANTATVYKVDPETGRLVLSRTIPVPDPHCVRFLQI